MLRQPRKLDADPNPLLEFGVICGHFDHVAGQCAAGLARVSLETGVPVAFGVLTTDTIEQAIERAGTKAGNKGADAALTALELANLLRRLDV